MTDPTPTPTPPVIPATPPTPAPPATPTSPADDEPLGAGGIKALNAERDARAAAEKALADMRKEIEDGKKSTEQKAADDLAAATRARDEAATRALRYEVAADKGLDLKFAARLTGSTKEELEADADALMALIPNPTAPPVPAGPTVPAQQPGGTAGVALVTQSDLDALAAAGKTDEINRLRREGRLTHLGVAAPKGR